MERVKRIISLYERVSAKVETTNNNEIMPTIFNKYGIFSK